MRRPPDAPRARAGQREGGRRVTRAPARVAAPRTEELRAADAHLVHPATSHGRQRREGPVVVTSGAGVTVTLADGRTAIDGMAGLWCVLVGYGRGELAEAAAGQMRTLAYASTFAGMASPPPLELAERLVAIAPPFVISDEQLDAILADAIIASRPSTTSTAIAASRAGR